MGETPSRGHTKTPLQRAVLMFRRGKDESPFPRAQRRSPATGRAWRWESALPRSLPKPHSSFTGLPRARGAVVTPEHAQAGRIRSSVQFLTLASWLQVFLQRNKKRQKNQDTTLNLSSETSAGQHLYSKLSERQTLLEEETEAVLSNPV